MTKALDSLVQDAILEKFWDGEITKLRLVPPEVSVILILVLNFYLNFFDALLL